MKTQKVITQFFKAGEVCLLFVLLLCCVTSFAQTTYYSKATGNWNNTSTWQTTPSIACGGSAGPNAGPPGSGDNVVICSGNTVTLNSSTTITDVTINASATFANANKQLTITGNYTNNGSHTGGNQPFRLAGVNTTIDGSGTISTGKFNMTTGDKTILPTANLTATTGNVNQVNIQGGITVTNQGTFTCGGHLGADVDASTWVNDAGATLNAGNNVLITGTLIASAPGNTVNYYNSSGNQDIKTATANTYYHFTSSGAGTKELKDSIRINGNFFNDGATFITGGFNVRTAGNWTNNGTLTDGGGTFIFSGSGNQIISTTNSEEQFQNMTVDKPGGVLTLNKNLKVAVALTMSGGNIDANSNKLTLGDGATATLTHTSGTVIGQFERWIGSTSPPVYLFPIGTSTDYRPASVTVNTLPSAGHLRAEFISSDPGTNGLPLDDGISPDSIRNSFVEGYWALTEISPANISLYDLDLTGTGFSSFTVNPTTRLLIRPNGSSNWSLEGAHIAATPPTVHRTGLGTLSAEYAFGDTTNCNGPVTSPITGNATVCTGDTEIYSVIRNPGNSYSWTATGEASISTNDTGDTATIIWGSTGRSDGNVRIVETNTCTQGAPVNLGVTIHTIVPASIAGKTNVPENHQNEPYSVAAISGYTYNWAITGGTLDIDNGDNITVDWGLAGSGNVRVVADSGGCASAAPVDKAINIYVIINSIGTGDWSDPTTWDCNCEPISSSSVRIRNTHTVTLDANNVTVNNFYIDAGGTFFDNAKQGFTVEGDIEVSGLYSGSRDLNLEGVSTTIDGTGQIATSGVVKIKGGNKTIASAASLNRSPGDVDIATGITVTNTGSFSIAGDLTGTSTSNWINAANSSLTIGGSLLSTGNLTATATNNTVTYNGGGGQNVKSTDYYNVSATGVSTTTLTANTIVYNDLTIGSSNTFDAAGFNINIAGDWINSGGTFIASTGTVIFNGSTTQTITNAAGENFNSVTIASGATVQTAGASDNVNLSGNWTNNGTYNVQSGTITFNGGGAQSIGGSTLTAFNDITINKSAGTATLSSAQNLIGTLTLTSGTISTGGQDFTLISTSSGTANIAEITGGDITGNIIMQRYFAAGATGYHFLSTPVSGITLNDWDQEMVLSIPDGNNGLACGTWCFWSAKFYDETLPGLSSIGYDSLGSIGDGIVDGKGYWMYTGTGLSSSTAYTIDARGPANKNFAPIDVTHTVSTGDIDDGWNLIGNPYPSDVNWDLVGLSGTLTPFGYVWDPNGGSYVSFDQSSGFALASHQALWVKVAEGGAGDHTETVTFGENSKTADGNNFLKTSGNPNPHLSINLAGAGYEMNTEIRFNQGATEAYDWQLDAYHLNNLVNDAPNLSTVTTSGSTTDLSINSVPDLSQNVSIPIRISWGSAGGSDTYTLSVDMEFIPPSSCIILEDLFPPYTITDLRQDSSVTFTMVQATNMPPHFMLHIGAQAIITSQDVSCNGADDGSATSTGQGTGPWVYTWLDQAGDTVSGPNNINGPDNVSNLTPGTYTVYTTASNSICQNAAAEITIDEPQLLTASAIQEDVICFGESDGNIYLTVNGGTPPYAYDWSNGNNLKDNLLILAGLHSVVVADDNNCTYTGSYTIIEPLELLTTASITDISCFGNNDGAIDLSLSGGSAPYEFMWNNGAANEDISNLPAGTYSIQITDDNNCIMVENGLEIQEGLSITAGFATQATGVLGELKFTNLSSGGLTYFWEFGDGETSTLENPVHKYAAKGNYYVILNVVNGVCSDTRLDMVSVADNPVGIENAKDPEQYVHVFSNGNSAIIEFNFNEVTDVKLEIFNIIGQQMNNYGKITVKQGNIAIPLSEAGGGIYLIRIETLPTGQTGAHYNYLERIVISD